MSKALFLLLVVVLFCLADSKRSCLRPNRTCKIQFSTPEAPPTCLTVTNDFGQPQEICQSSGSTSFTAQFTKDKSSYAVKQFPIADVNFSGYCRCMLQVWTEPNFGGETTRHLFSKSPSHEFTTADIWDNKINSFEIKCKF